MYVFDDETLAYSEGTGQKTLKNLQQNPKVAVMVVDREKTDGYQVKGTAELLSSGISLNKWQKSRRKEKATANLS